MNDSTMGNGYIMPNADRGFLVGAMNDHTILDVNVITDSYAVDITSDDRIKPYTAIITNYNIACDGGIIRYKTPFSPFGLNAFYRSY
jgi:hypothetical protein